MSDQGKDSPAPMDFRLRGRLLQRRETEYGLREMRGPDGKDYLSEESM